MTPPPVPECLKDGVPLMLTRLRSLHRSVIDTSPETKRDRRRQIATLRVVGDAIEAIAYLAEAHDYERQRPRAELELHDLRLLRQLLDGERLSDTQRTRLAAVLDEAITETTD
jgi:hypothetical protein